MLRCVVFLDFCLRKFGTSLDVLDLRKLKRGSKAY